MYLENKTIFEFHGCWHHACLKCSSETIFNKSSGLIFKSIYIRHKDWINYIKEKMPDFKLEEIRKHEWKGKLIIIIIIVLRIGMKRLNMANFLIWRVVYRIHK